MDSQNDVSEGMAIADLIQHYFEDRNEGHGFFIIPRGLLAMVQDGYISKLGFTLIMILLHLENRFNKIETVFFHTDKRICSTKLLSLKSLALARKELKGKGLIDYKSGYPHHATEYLLLIPRKYLYEHEDDSIENYHES